jgi:hypothetical protein
MLKYAEQVKGALWMILLKPRERHRRLVHGTHQVINFFAKNQIDQHTLDLAAHDRLEDNPGIMCEFPEYLTH